MSKKYTILLFIINILKVSYSLSINGFDVLEKSYCYIDNNIVYSKDKKNNKIITQLDLRADTTIQKYIRTMASTKGYLSTDIESSNLLKKFNSLNITYNHNKYFVAISIKFNINDKKRTCYAIIALSSKLKPINYYYFKSEAGIYSEYILPFQNLLFTDTNKVQLTYHNDKYQTRTSEFKLNDKNNNLTKLKEKVVSSNKIGGKVLMLEYKVTLEYPLLGIVSNSKSLFHVIYPYSLIYLKDSLKYDPFNELKIIDSISKKIESTNLAICKNYKCAMNSLKYCILATNEFKNIIYLATLTSDNQIIISKYNTINGKSSQQKITLSCQNTDVLIKDNILFYLDADTPNIKLMSLALD